MFSLMIVRPTYQMIESAPIQSVDVLGVRLRGWMVPNIEGAAFTRAIDRDVRAVGRIVVWVDAAADVRTAITRIMFQGVPNTWVPSRFSTSSWSSSCAGPPK